MGRMISMTKIVLQRGALRLLDKASLIIHTGCRVGVIGANGSGKSSLFKLLLHELALDEGEVSIPRQWRVAHMAQEVCSSERSAVDYVMDGDTGLRRIEAEIARTEIIDTESAHLTLAKLYADLEAIHGYQAKNRAEKLLHGLGFKQSQVEEPVSSFSGGWRIRLNLAQALMCPSDLLLLDEPTNHLDLDATLWLEQWLKAYAGTLLLISHDRDFLDNVVSDIVHLEAQQLQSYSGNYSAYEQQRAERLAQQQALYNKQQQRIGEINKFVARFRAKATKAKQAQSRLKELARMEMIAPAHVDSPFHFTFREAEKNSDPLILLRDAQLGYGGLTQKPVLRNVDIRFPLGARIGLLGVNGAGKSTLVKGLVGDLKLQTGERVCGEHLKIGYFAQHQLEALDLKASALLHIQRLSLNASEQSIRNFLGSFNFHGDKALGAINTFSGGEKARLALAIIIWQRPNLLLLDEPTNHLDLEMRHALTVALQSYSGALLVISHDRHLLRNTIDEFYLVANSKVQSFSGTLEDYQQWAKQVDQRDAFETEEPVIINHESVQIDKKLLRQQAANRRAAVKPLTDKIRQLEKEMHTAQTQLQEIEKQLADGEIYCEEKREMLQTLLNSQGAFRKIVQETETEWISLQEELEIIDNSS